MLVVTGDGGGVPELDVGGDWVNWVMMLYKVYV